MNGPRRLARLMVALSVVLVVLTACASAPVQQLPVVKAVYHHDDNAFTQGLLLHEGRLYESTGLYGESSLREVDLETGEVVRARYLIPELFGEGLALVDDRLVQLTWRSGRALVYDMATFEPVGEFRYQGEGWGLCFDGEQLWMSDGSATLTARDPDTFEAVGRVEVELGGEPLERLNELACVDGDVYANVWLTDTIVRIDPESGRVEASIDASSLLAPEERANLSPDAVLNGIAHDPETGLFYLTGKLWPKLFAVEFE